MMINDVGKTFGTASMFNEDKKSAVNLEEWSDTPIWKDKDACVAHLSKSFTGSLEHPTDQRRRAQVSQRSARPADRSAVARPFPSRALRETRSDGVCRRLGSDVQAEARGNRFSELHKPCPLTRE